MTYKAFSETVLCGIRLGSWTFDELWGNVPVPQKVLDLIDRVGDGRYQRYMVRMDEEGKFGKASFGSRDRPGEAKGGAYDF